MNDILYEFIWEGTSRVKKITLCQDYCDGGLKMIDINAFITSLKSTWLRKSIIDNNSQWSLLLHYNVDIQNILNVGTAYISEKILPKIKNKFWMDVFLSHIQTYRKIIPKETEQFLACPIFYNGDIKIGNKIIFNKSCFKNGIKFINDITKENVSMYTYDELKATYNVKINFLQYTGLVKSIIEWRKKIKLEAITNSATNPILPLTIQIYFKKYKGCTKHVQTIK